MEDEKLSTSQRIKQHKPIEIWELPDGSWKWEVYKKYQKDDEKPYARWFVKAFSPFVPQGEMGDTYVKEIKESGAHKLEKVI
jgi:hypothetical protein